MTYVRCTQASIWLFRQVVDSQNRKIFAKFHTAVISRKSDEGFPQLMTILIQAVQNSTPRRPVNIYRHFEVRKSFIFMLKTFRIRLLIMKTSAPGSLQILFTICLSKRKLYWRRLKAKNSLGQTEISHCSRLVTRAAEHT